MRTPRHLVALLLLPPLSGCLNFSYGTKAPTLAREIAELKRLRDRGTISAQDFEKGKYALLNPDQKQPNTLPTDSGTQMAVHPVVSDDPVHSQ